MSASQTVERLGRGWQRRFERLVASAEHGLTLSSAYVTAGGIDTLLAHAAPGVLQSGEVVLLTDLSPEHAAQGATDPEAINRLFDHAARLRLVHLPRLHGKVYVADGREAIVTSGNLTAGGLRANYEYGLCLSDPDTAAGIRADVLDYAALGAPIRKSDLAEFCAHTRDARAALAEATPPAPAQARFRDAVRQARDVIVRGYGTGEAVHAVFERTVLYVLSREGPLTTPDLHEHVRALHPDLCGDEDRVIGGENFGRKWKHAVRTAQQHLKRRGAITNDGDQRWSTT